MTRDFTTSIGDPNTVPKNPAPSPADSCRDDDDALSSRRRSSRRVHVGMHLASMSRQYKRTAIPDGCNERIAVLQPERRWHATPSDMPNLDIRPSLTSS